jgi:hypothetical protein
MATPMRARAAGRSSTAGMTPLPPQRKWLVITIATLMLVPAYWSMLAAMVSVATNDVGGPRPGPALAFGLAMVPFVFVVMAFMSGHTRAPGAVLRAMLLAIVVGIPVSALAADAVTGMVAGVGAGAIAALRRDRDHTVKARVIGVAVATLYTFVLLRMAGGIALLAAPIFPFTSIGIADHLSERRREREAAEAS